jgi:hypothetical protein
MWSWRFEEMLNEKRITSLLAIFFVALSVGFVVHRSPTFAGSFVGHLIGIAGALLMCCTLIYPFRKRVQKKRGKKNPLNPHIYYGLIGPCLVVVHSAHKFSSLIGVVCFLSMFLVVISGIVGKFLFRRVNRTLKQQQMDLSLLTERFEKVRKEANVLKACVRETNTTEPEDETVAEGEELEYKWNRKYEELLDVAHSLAETEYVVKAFSGTKLLFRRWLRIHYLLALLLFSMMIVHILASFYYGIRWL